MFLHCPTCPVRPELDCLGEINPGACSFAQASEEFRISLARRAEAMAFSVAEPGKPLPPGLLAKAANLARAVVQHAVAGFPTTDEATAQARLAICRECPDFNTSDPDNPSCNRCGCQMNVKIYWSEQRCPAGKW